MQASRKFLVIGSTFGLTGVALGAFGAHSLRSMISTEMLSVFETGVRYQMYHTFALYAVSWFQQTEQRRQFEIAAWLFIAGIMLFSGSLYLLAITNIRSFGVVTPLGGLCLLGGWFMSILGFMEKKSK